MRLGEVIGGLSVAGLLVIIGLSMTSDTEPESVSTGGSTFVWDPPSTTSVVPSTTAAPSDTAASTTSAATPPSESSETTATTSSVPPTSSTGATSTTAERTAARVRPLPESRRATITVRVVNGGADEGAESFVSGALKVSGFEPLEPGTAAEPVAATTVLYAGGRRREALTVNKVIEAPDELVIEAPADDPNWHELGEDVDVLVVVGPSS